MRREPRFSVRLVKSKDEEKAMGTVVDHYDSLLGLHYSWLMGGFEENVARNGALFAELGIVPRRSGLAVDLGCGSGFQSIPLAQAGFTVTAMDTSHQLLIELERRACDFDVHAIEEDFRKVAHHLPAQVGVAVCMGDTLAHLNDRAEVEGFLKSLHEVVEPGGKVLLTFRDQTKALAGTDRFLQLRGDDSRIFSCFLEYGQEHLDVTDLLHIRTKAGWKLYTSQYRKVRLTAELVGEYCSWAGFVVKLNRTEKGMVTLLAEK